MYKNKIKVATGQPKQKNMSWKLIPTKLKPLAANIPLKTKPLFNIITPCYICLQPITLTDFLIILSIVFLLYPYSQWSIQSSYHVNSHPKGLPLCHSQSQDSRHAQCVKPGHSAQDLLSLIGESRYAVAVLHARLYACIECVYIIRQWAVSFKINTLSVVVVVFSYSTVRLANTIQWTANINARCWHQPAIVKRRNPGLIGTRPREV